MLRFCPQQKVKTMNQEQNVELSIKRCIVGLLIAFMEDKAPTDDKVLKKYWDASNYIFDKLSDYVKTNEPLEAPPGVNNPGCETIGCWALLCAEAELNIVFECAESLGTLILEAWRNTPETRDFGGSIEIPSERVIFPPLWRTESFCSCAIQVSEHVDSFLDRVAIGELDYPQQ